MSLTKEKPEKTSFLAKVSQAFTPKAEIKHTTYLVLGVFGFLLVLAVWSLLTYGKLVDNFFLPTPSETFQSGISLFTQLDFTGDVAVTIYRVMTGFVLAAIVAVPLGIMLGVYKPIEGFLEPLMSFVRYLPASAFIPLFILWIGVSETQKIAVIFMGSFPQLILMVAAATKNVADDLIDVSYTLGTSKKAVLWHVILPASMPAIMSSLRMILGWAWTYIIVAELVGASSGIGYMIIQSQRMLNTSNIFVGILTIGVIGLIFDYVFKWLSRLLFPWS
ncbi:ABC transporter permease [Sporolactobacillus spathodeae]|uniref:NitT/TauT family transport system permease protein n=1 Tax=Sporolactobacillus spathodeae TaxID=1465502 RepID=A0ABS2Q9K7_9BACL|nr:ABC transporter permease [Sporolactobacillus spathodeae]MBM7658125.1 NitT/TauT family transport system permease protein [Sporolactobacillus spathodeae]